MTVARHTINNVFCITPSHLTVYTSPVLSCPEIGGPHAPATPRYWARSLNDIRRLCLFQRRLTIQIALDHHATSLGMCFGAAFDLQSASNTDPTTCRLGAALA